MRIAVLVRGEVLRAKCRRGPGVYARTCAAAESLLAHVVQPLRDRGHSVRVVYDVTVGRTEHLAGYRDHVAKHVRPDHLAVSGEHLGATQLDSVRVLLERHRRRDDDYTVAVRADMHWVGSPWSAAPIPDDKVLVLYRESVAAMSLQDGFQGIPRGLHDAFVTLLGTLREDHLHTVGPLPVACVASRMYSNNTTKVLNPYFVWCDRAVGVNNMTEDEWVHRWATQTDRGRAYLSRSSGVPTPRIAAHGNAATTPST